MSKSADVKKQRGRPKKSEKIETSEKTVMKPQVSDLRVDAPAANYFVLCNGKHVKNVKELADIMDNIEDHVFTHHVRPDHNDFSAWVQDIFKDVELAKKLSTVNDRKNFQLTIYKHITHKLW